MKLTDRTVADLLAAFQSSEPTPGGGSASALAAAIGASLLAMAAGLPKARAAVEEDRRRLHAAAEQCAELAADLAALVDEDSNAYQRVMSAFRQPRSTDEEKAARIGAIQESLKGAIAAPLRVMRGCAAALEQAVLVGSLANPSAASDVLVGLELLQAGLRGAKLNVQVNLDSVKDADYIQRIRNEVAAVDRAGTRHLKAARAHLEKKSSA